jgi:2-hydroxychromene-2-carboxylate isomerase
VTPALWPWVGSAAAVGDLAHVHGAVHSWAGFDPAGLPRAETLGTTLAPRPVKEAAVADLEFFFDPVCPFCWNTSRWVRGVQEQRDLRVRWRFISLAMLNEHEGAYDEKPDEYPDAHHRGLELLRVCAAAGEGHGSDVIGPLYRAMGRSIWHAEPPAEPAFEAILAHTARAGDVAAILDEVGLPPELADAVSDERFDTVIRRDTEAALTRAGGDVGTPVLSFSPPHGPAFFGPVISEVPRGEQALELWDAVTVLGRWDGFAEIKRPLRSFPVTPVTAKLAGQRTTAA